MKLTKYLAMAVTAVATMGLAGCSSDSPFDSDGEGTLRLRMVVNSEVTRAAMDQQTLADSCWVYISDAKGLLHKYHGLENLPTSLPLRSGHYVAEAWTGDSVSASFDSKFYRGYQPFDISRDNVSSVVVNCRIANVVASVNPADNVKDKIRNYTVTIANTAGSLDFNADNVATAHGYYMMPDDDNTLTWNITGENADGKPFTKSGKVENVKRAHEYILNLKYNPDVSGDDSGGGFITVTVNDVELLIEDEITLHAAPVIQGEGFDASAVYSTPRGSFSDLIFKIYAYQGFSSIQMSTASATELGLPTQTFDLLNVTDEAAATLRAAGIQWQTTYKADLEQTNALVTLKGVMLNKLTDGEHTIDFRAVDSQGRTRLLTWKINVSDNAVEALDIEQGQLRSYSATLRGSLVKEEYTNPGFEYRRSGESDWQKVAGVLTRAGQEYTARLTALLPGTTYEYRAVADGFVNPKVLTFTTEDIFSLPNAGFEQWVKNSKGAWIPGADATPSFWDTGNHGSITMSKNITNPAENLLHSGTYSAQLSSQFVGVGIIGKFAAGNIFAGTYDGTDGTDGILTFGRPFNGTHPVKLRGWANYRPGTVDKYAGGGLSKGDTDQGMVYVALTTKTYKIETKNTTSHPRVLFDPNDAGVLAYGEIVWTGNFGADGQMAEFEIDITPRSGYWSSRPAYIVLVCSASRYGDYFAGGNSVLYLDDLELVYE